MLPLLAMKINEGWFLILLGGLVVYLSMRYRRQPTPAVAKPELAAEIPCVLPAEAPCRPNPLRNPKFSRPPAFGVIALTAGGACVLLCLLLVLLCSSTEATFVSYGGPVIAQEHAVVAVERNLLALERMQQAEEARLRQQGVLLQPQNPAQPPALEPLPAPRPEVAVQAPEARQEAQPGQAGTQPAEPKQVAAAVPLPPQLQPQPQTKPKAINPTRTSAARSQVIVVEGEYQKSHEAAWRSFLEQAQVDIKEHLRERGVILDAPPTRELIENKMIDRKDRKPEERDFGGNVGVVRRYVLEVQVTPEVRALLAQQDREFRAQQRMLLLGKILAGIVVLLAAAALYFRLDEYTKGYYTSSLRWAALGVVTGFIVFLLFGS